MAEAIQSRLPTDYACATSSLRVLVVTNMFPSASRPYEGTFVQHQVASLNEANIACDVLYLDRARDGRRIYRQIPDKLGGRIQEFGPQLLHVMYGGIMAHRVVRAANELPVVISFCGSDLFGSVGSSPITWCRNAITKRASRQAAMGAAGVIVKSKNLYWQLPAQIRGTIPVAIIPNGIDLREFHPHPRSEALERLGWSPEHFHVVFCSHGTPRVKRQWLAEAAVNLYQDRYGEGGKPIRLHVLDRIAHRDVPYWLSASDVLLVTSRHEGSPNIVKESLACDLPIVSVDVGDVAERIRGVDGCFLADARPDDICRALKAVADRNQRTKGRVTLRELDPVRIARKIREFYEIVLSEGASDD